MNSTLWSGEGLGTHWWVTTEQNISSAAAVDTAEILAATIRNFELNYSRFLQESFVGQLNQGNSLGDFPSELYEMALWGETLRVLSKGYFTLAAGSILRNLGYDSGYSFTASTLLTQEVGSPFAVLTPEEIQLIPERQLDLGGIGKGWLIDSLAQILEQKGISSYCVNGGGDAFVVGTEQNFALEHPFEQGQAIGEITVRSGAIAASGGAKRRWRDRETGLERHHLVDPFTGETSNRRAGVFTSAPTAKQADAASTLLYLVPDELVPTVAKELHAEYLLVQHDGSSLCSPGYCAKLYT